MGYKNQRMIHYLKKPTYLSTLLAMKKPKILIIAYGGTITMVVDSATKSVRPPNDIREVLDLLPHTEELAELHMDILSDKDSTNV